MTGEKHQGDEKGARNRGGIYMKRPADEIESPLTRGPEHRLVHIDTTAERQFERVEGRCLARDGKRLLEIKSVNKKEDKTRKSV